MADSPHCRFPRCCVSGDDVCAVCPQTEAPIAGLQKIALQAPGFFAGDDPDEFRMRYIEWRSRLIHAAGGCSCLRT